MKAYIFPGQGSQSRGMGGTLFDEFPELTEKADKILEYSIKDLCFNDPRKELNKTQFTQPALYVVNALSYYKKIQESGEMPDYVAGHSLGEFNALLAAECFDFETGLKLVKKRGELMSQATDGAMAAILNATREHVEALLKDNGFDDVDIANYNTPLQIVISGPVAQVMACQTIFQFDNVMYVPLNTSGAFHSRLVRPAQSKFETFLKKRKFADPKIPVIANLTAEPYTNGAIVDHLSKQISSTVLWSDTIQYLMNISGDMQFVEVGHGDVLTKMIANIKRQLAKIAEKAASPVPTEESKPAANSDNVESVTNAENAVIASPAENRDTTPIDNRFALVEQKIAAWNERHPVGTKVKSLVMDYGVLTTRTSAIGLFGHRAAIYMEGYNGYFDLDEIAVA